MKTYAGIDLHSSNNYIGVINAKDKRLYSKRVLSASVRWAKKLFKASSLRQGVRVSVVHPAVQDRSKVSWFLDSGGFNLRRGSGVVPWHPPVRAL
jgi:hypothetical protein